MSSVKQAYFIPKPRKVKLVFNGSGSRLKMEHQSDMYISTLQKLVSAMSGHLELVASFPEREVVLNQFD